MKAIITYKYEERSKDRSEDRSENKLRSIKNLLYTIVFAVPLFLAAQTQTENYIKTTTYRAPSTGVITENDTLVSVTYFDGLGRPKQMVSVKAGGQGQDIITPVVYDGFGRQTRDYLPYAAPTQNGELHIDPLQELEAFYNAGYGSVPNPYSEKVLEASPLGRIMEQGAPGAAWMADPLGDTDHTIKFEYRANATDEVRLYQLSTTADNYSPGLATFVPALEALGFYSAGSLYKTITKDENWQPGDGNFHTTEEFKDLQGSVVLKRTYNSPPLGEPEGAVAHDTYYVYDDFGNLSFVIPPKVDTSDGVSQDELDELCYQYVYDHRNRLVEKKLPGKQWEYIVYNEGDLPVLTQDQHLRDQEKWLFTKYDAFGRALYSGLFSSADSREALQIALEGHPIYEESTDTTAVIDTTDVYYSNTTFPNTGLELLTVHYYDDYNFDLDGGTAEDSYGISPTTNTKSLNTGSKVRVMGTGQWITTVLYYDEKARLIYSYTKNDYLGTEDNIKQKLDFTGNVLETTAVHTKDGQADITSVDKFTYDHTGRLLKHTHQMAGHPEEVLAENSYDELGQLVQKKTGNTTAMPLQTVDYSYNIRGWLTSINDVNNLGEDLFGFNIRYNDPVNGATALYNGNISETRWRTNNTDNSLKHYSYSYDALNRITGATDNTGNYNLNAVTYDKNGNILSLSRQGHLNEAADNFGTMDELVYSYDSGNKLLKVEDTAHDTFGFKDDAQNTPDNSDDYTYDLNGNMLSDTNKGITSIAYNHLSLPTEIIFNNDPSRKISYIYSADGIKQQKVVSDNAALTTTDYAGAYIYENSSLKFVNHPEGYIEPDGAGGYDYVYQYKDHLGNVRLSYSDNAQVLTDNSFESTTEGWGGNASVVSVENGKLKTEVSNQWAGAQKFLDVAPGDEIHYQMLLDKATTQSLNLVFFEHDGSYVKLFGITIAPNADGFISGSYTVSQGVKLRIKIEKGAGADTGVPTYYYLDDVKVAKKEIVVREEKNYYPFGLAHRGYNTQVNGAENKFLTYNGVENEEALGFNVYEMDMRQYDPAIARWIVMDPVVHHNMSPYNAFDNNPVFWADPSGADAQTLFTNLWNYRNKEGRKLFNNDQVDFTEDGDDDESCCEDDNSPSIGEIIGATVRGWWSSIFGGGRDDVEILAENGLVEEAQKLEEQTSGTVAYRTQQLEEYWKALGIIPGSMLVEGFAEADQGNYLKALGLMVLGSLDFIGGGGKKEAAKRIWSSTKKLSPVENAFSHWLKHGKEFPNLKNAKQYVGYANNFLRSTNSEILTKVRKNGDVLRYDPKNNIFGVMNAKGEVRTLFKPKDGIDYWLKQ